jgi:phosphonopyruvate decarboxylase
MIDASSFVTALKRFHYSQFVGVPCSYLKPFINYVIDDPTLDYIGAASEGEAVAISLGAFLAGRKTVTMCQNSGLGNMVNPLTSLNFPFRIPTLLIVTWRGQPGGVDEPQHEQMGQITTKLLDLLDIPWSIFPQVEDEIDPVIAKADAYMQDSSRPYALVMPEDSVAGHELQKQQRGQVVVTSRLLYPAQPGNRLTRTEAIELILSQHPADRAIIATTGKTGRELFTVADSPANIYVVGGMGTASAIGLGISHALPAQAVTVIDGDGAALMKLGTLATIGYYQPANFLHIILDNEQHDSTGGQQTVSSTVRFAEVAAGVNYSNTAFAESRDSISEAVKTLLSLPGPSLLHIKIKPGSPAKLGRPTIKPHEVKQRFMAFLQTHR